jgi:hypothetical protein
MDIAACVEKLCPNPQFKGSATIPDRADWEGREWIDARPRPSWIELQAIWPTVEQEIAEPPPQPTVAELVVRIEALEGATRGSV